MGLRQMVRHLGLPFQDQADCKLCMRDASEVARVLQGLIKDGWKPTATAWRKSVSDWTHFLLPGRSAVPPAAAGVHGTAASISRSATPDQPPAAKRGRLDIAGKSSDTCSGNAG